MRGSEANHGGCVGRLNVISWAFHTKDDPVRRERRIQFQEIDAAGVLYFAQFHDIAHQVYDQALLEVGYDLSSALAAKQYGYPLVHTEADFRWPLRYGDTVAIDVSCTRIGEKSYTIATQWSLSASAETVASLTHIHACVDMNTMQSAPVPCALIAALERLQV